MNYQLNSENINELITAFSKAQGEFTSIAKNCNNPFYKSKYADLNSVIEMIQPILAKHELAVNQQMVPVHEGDPLMITTLSHKSGQWMRSYTPILLPQNKRDCQEMGKGISYIRRYSLCSLLNLGFTNDDEDDDGNSISGATIKRSGSAYSRRNTVQEKQDTPPIKKPTDIQIASLEEELIKYPNYCKYTMIKLADMKIDSLEDITIEIYTSILAGIKKQKELENNSNEINKP